MGIFGLAKTTAKTSLANTDFAVDDGTCASRLAKVFGVDEAGLLSELQRLRPMAMRFGFVTKFALRCCIFLIVAQVQMMMVNDDDDDDDDDDGYYR